MYNLILVDDESRVRRGLRNCIDWPGLGISLAGEASNGFEALKLTEALQPDLIITDIKMPEMDGLEFIRLLREKCLNAVIIIISGYNDFTFAQKAIQYEVSDYLLKPIKESELKSILSRCIKKIESQRANLEQLQKAVDEAAKSKLLEKEQFLKNQMEKARTNALVEKALQYILENYARDITLNAIAEQVHLHPNYLSKLFTETTGESFTRCLTKARMAKAKEFLRQPEYKIYEVAYKVGYNDFRHFSRLFKHYEGVTPVEYKKKMLK